MRTSIISVSVAGHLTASRIAAELGFALYTLYDGVGSKKIESIDGFLKDNFHDCDALVFVGAMGICVRSIAPYLVDKHSDPAVVCVDCTGHFAVSVVSGHIGGANNLAKSVASSIGAMPVITTQSDRLGLWSLDTLGRRFGWYVVNSDMNRQIALFTSGKPTALLLEIRDKGTDWLESNLPENVKVFYRLEDVEQSMFSLIIAVVPKVLSGLTIPAVTYLPKAIHVGIGLAHEASPASRIIEEIFVSLETNGIPRECIADISTIDLKKNEPVISALSKDYAINFFTSNELNVIDVPNPNEKVKHYMGSASVAEASAIAASSKGCLVMEKNKGADWTAAAAIDGSCLRRGHIEIVGAGPGDPDLVSVRGRQMLERADLILYAGSLVPRELTECAKDGATVRSSASMALGEQCALMKKFYDKGAYIVRLHTGDPCIFGAIQEQMAFFDDNKMDYHITPGISSFLAAAAELRSQFTIPEKVQTIILTRGEGRTPMPEREKLHLLARSRSTMCIFLSAAIVDDVQKELLAEYPEETPVAACYHLTWKDQHIYRGVLKDLAKIVKDNKLTLTTMLVVGDSIDNRHGLSELYSSSFSHLFRKASE